jgi:cysteine-rich repeat protein
VRYVVLLFGLGLYGCFDLEAPNNSLNCSECLPACVADADPADLEGSARRAGCDPGLVVDVLPRPGWMEPERLPEIVVEFSRPLRMQGSGLGCDGPIRLRRVGAVGEIPAAVKADIVTHASLHSLPLWPANRECVEGRWTAEGKQLRFSVSKALDVFDWYEVVVSKDIDFGGARLCSQLAWRFAVSACGNGIVDTATSFTDWVCLGHVIAERGWFDPYSEECDDGNTLSNDGCSAQCVHETGWTCDRDGCHTRCGDGVRTGIEACDFGANRPPGCNAQCQVEPGYVCDWKGCTKSARNEGGSSR